MFGIAEETGKSQGSESQHIVHDHLDREVNIRLNDELKNTVSCRRQNTGAHAEKIARQADKQHTEQGYRTAKRERIELDHGSHHGQCHRYGTEGQMPGTHTLFLFSLLGESCGSHENSDQNQKHGYIACCSELVGIIHHCYEK